MLNEQEQRIIGLIRDRSVPLKPLPTGLGPKGALRGPVRAVLFDLYGTLFISGSGDISVSGDGDAGTDAIQDDKLGLLLKGYGILEKSTALRQRFTERIREVHASRRSEGVDYPEVVIEEIWRDVLGFASIERAREFALDYELLFNPVWPMPGLTRLFGDLEGSGRLLGIVSNAQFYTPYLFDALLGRSATEIGFSDELALYSSVYGYAKPSTYLFDRAAEALAGRGIDPMHVLYVGNDMLNDVLASSRVGFQTALFAGDRRSLRLRKDDVRCSGISPDVTVKNLTELSDCLKQHKS
jgi:putative hydrolase of the HAD superfamily